jgi:hypothetical protein
MYVQNDHFTKTGSGQTWQHRRKSSPKTLYFAGWLYNVFGFDVVFEGPSADAVLLEVNVFPAIAGGTMSAVPREVYARLVDDTLRLLAPVLDSGCAGGAGAGECSLGADLGGYTDLGLACRLT